MTDQLPDIKSLYGAYRLVPSIVIFFLVIFASCADRSRYQSELDGAEALMEEHPDSALALIDGIDEKQLGGSQERARYALLKSMALDKNYVDTTDFAVLQPAIDHYLRHGSPDQKLRTLFYQGRIFQNRGDNDQALQRFIECIESNREITDSLTLARAMVARGGILYGIYRIEDFLNDNLQASSIFAKQGKGGSAKSCLKRGLHGAIILNDRPKSDSILRLLKAKGLQDSELAPEMLNYAVSFEDLDAADSMLSLYKDKSNLAKNEYCDLVRAYSLKGDFRRADSLLHIISELYPVICDPKFLLVASEIQDSLGTAEKALAFYKRFHAINDTVQARIFAQDLQFAQERWELRLYAAQEKESKEKALWIFMTLVLAFFLMLAAILHWHRASIKRRKAEEAQLNGKIRDLEDELVQLQELQTEQQALAASVSEAIKNRIALLNELLYVSFRKDKESMSVLMEKADDLIADKDKFMNSTRLAFSASHPEFISYLEEHGLTEFEINYICLYAVGLRGKEVGTYLKMRSHYNISSEIRRKLGIDEYDTNLRIYIQKLLKKLV